MLYQNKSFFFKIFVMKIFLLSSLWIFTLFGEWDPEYCFPDDDLGILEDVLYKNLKSDIIFFLKGSWCSVEKAELLMDLIYVTKPAVCVEIGAFSGSTVLPVAATLKYLQHGTVIAIDPWSNAIATQNMDFNDPNRPWWSTVNMDGIYAEFVSKLARWKVIENCTIFRSTSETAANFIQEIDFLHLDGDYSEKGSLKDVELYLPKVKPGGYILLSNLFLMVHNKAPKMKCFSELFDACEMISEIDKDNAVLFRKYE